jgi:hypothetical protein
MKIISTDYASAAIFIFTGALWLMYLVFGVLGIQPGRRGRNIDLSGPGLMIAAAAFTILLIPIAIYRIRAFKGLFSRGLEVKAIVTNTEFYNGRGKIDFNYLFQGKSYNGTATVRENNQSMNVGLQTEIMVIVDPQNPQKAVIRDLFTGF